VTADSPPAAGRLKPDNRTLAIARPDLDRLHRIRAQFREETGIAYTIPATLHRIILEWSLHDRNRENP
jgi:hypothetical protein